MNASIYPYGAWPSPIQAQWVAQAGQRFSQLKQDNNRLYWLTMRPDQQGRQIIQCSDAEGNISTVTTDACSVGSRVHEYGGGDYTVYDNVVFYTQASDQRIYRQTSGQQAQPLTPLVEGKQYRYADYCVVDQGQGLIGVRETHYQQKVINELVWVATDGSEIVNVLCRDFDFYASPCFSPDQQSLAWLCWRHPGMPWDGCELWVAKWSGTKLIEPRQIAGCDQEAIYQPVWHENTLLFISDRTGWGNLYSYQDDEVVALAPIEQECATPLWVLGTNTFVVIEGEHYGVIMSHNGLQQVAIINQHTQQITTLATEMTDIMPYLVYHAGCLYYIGANATTPYAIYRYDVEAHYYEKITSSAIINIDQTYLSLSQPIHFPTADDQIAHAFYYPPSNGAVQAPEGDLPPLLVISHGGPTAATGQALNLKIQYWTSRGFAVVDVNYRGSTGFGRQYQQSLHGQWGIADVEDCVNAAVFCIQQGWVDEKRCAIRGSSAGGFTTLCALTFYNVFCAGASYYGVADPMALTTGTHKFEQYYTDQLIGKLPQDAAIFEARSPVSHADKLTCPIIFFQGEQDEVVPPSQAQAMIAAMADKGLPYAYLSFAEERHGFRCADTVVRCLQAETVFYQRVFGLPVTEDLPELEITNLE